MRGERSNVAHISAASTFKYLSLTDKWINRRTTQKNQLETFYLPFCFDKLSKEKYWRFEPTWSLFESSTETSSPPNEDWQTFFGEIPQKSLKYVPV